MVATKIKKLIKCVLLDLVGMISIVFPVIGPIFDVIWAPIAATISYKMFGSKRGKYTSIITFIEEILPMADVFPSFTFFCLLFDIIGLEKEHPTEKSQQASSFIHSKYIEAK